MEQDNLISVLFKFIKYLKASVTRDLIEEELLKHPSCPSWLAITDVLKNWNISCTGYNVPFELRGLKHRVYKDRTPNYCIPMPACFIDLARLREQEF